MGTKIKIFLAILAVVTVTVVLTWAPWLDDKEIHDRVLREWGQQDGTIDRINGRQLCDYEVKTFALGRLVTSCEGGYYVTFWGQIL